MISVDITISNIKMEPKRKTAAGSSRGREAAVTDLEGAALALFVRAGRATRYAVMQAFANSPSAFWSGSAGAVYPMIRRLLARKMLTAHAATDGRRKRVDYAVTAEGRAAFEAWLLDPRRAADMGMDPLRTRLVSLDLVPAARRKAFLKEVAVEVARIAEAPAFENDPAGRAIHESWLQARAAWIASLG